jgi:hypothetical protein
LEHRCGSVVPDGRWYGPVVADSTLPERLQADLKVALRARDHAGTVALRTTLAAFANAEAPPLPDASPVASPVIGLVEHDRLALTSSDHQQIIRDQIAARLDAAKEYDDLGQVDAAAVLRGEIAVLRRYTSP